MVLSEMNANKTYGYFPMSVSRDNCTSLSLIKNGILQTASNNLSRCHCLPGFYSDIPQPSLTGEICHPQTLENMERIDFDCCHPLTPDFLTSGLIVSLVIITNALIFAWSFMKYRFKKESRRHVQILPSDSRLPAFACPERLKRQVKSVMTRSIDIGQLTSKKKKSRSIRIFQREKEGY